MNDSAVWAANGEHEMSAERARELAWIATGGQTGVVGPGSLRVRATATPGGSVEILPGGFAIQANPGGSVGYATAPWQSYMRALYQTLTVPITATGSSGGRTDVVGIVIDDPQYEGTSESVDWQNHEFYRVHVVENAPSGASRPEHFSSLSRPFLPLARIVIPANTGTITNAMITDLRFLAVKRTEQENFVQAVTTTRNLTLANNSSFTELQQFADIFVPQWATHMKLDGEIIGAASVGALVRGETVLRFNAGGSNRLSSTIPWRSEDNDWGRLDLPIAGRIELTEQERGREGFFRFLVRITGGTGTLRISDEVAHYRVRVTFEEAPTGALTGS